MNKEVMSAILHYTSCVTMVTEYTHWWSDEFSKSHVIKCTNKLRETLSKHIDFNNLTIEEARDLGFAQYPNDLWLIPLYLLAILPVGIIVYDIFGKPIVNTGKNLDNEVRFGCIAYGLKLTK